MSNINIAAIVKDELGLPGLADAYKPTHGAQYPVKTEIVHVYFEARRSQAEHDYIVYAGEIPFLKQYLSSPVTQANVDAATKFWEEVGVPFCVREGFQIIVDEFNGYLPLEIRALKEGTVANVHTALYTMKNTDPRFFWLPAFIETIRQQNIWYPTTVATRSWDIKRLQMQFLGKSSTEDISSLDYKLHDFGFRGTTCLEQAILGGMAHLINYKGSDTSVANMGVKKFYGDYGDNIPSNSIPAMEHMTSTIWKKDNESVAVEHFIRTFCIGEGRMGSVIGDTYNIFGFCREILGKQLRDLIVNDVANSGGCVVARPDSGPPDLIPVKVINLLMDIFGYTTNIKGYKVLPSYIRVIQGDGMDSTSIRSLYRLIDDEMLSIDNICVGMGGGLLQKVHRDTYSMAQKGSLATVEGETYGISKDPFTDPGKKSQEGDFAVVRDPKTRKLINIQRCDLGDRDDYLETVYLNGVILRAQTWDDVRARAHVGLLESLLK